MQDEIAYGDTMVGARVAGPDRIAVKVGEERLTDLRGAVELFIQLRQAILQLLGLPARPGP